MKKIVSFALLGLIFLTASLTTALTTSCDEEDFLDKKAELKALVALAELKLQDEHTSDSWTAFAAAINNAKQILSHDKPTAEALEAAINSLITSMAALVDSAVLRKNLAAAIQKAEAWVNNNYSEGSWGAFQSAIDEAKVVYADHNASLKELESVLKKLLAAFDSLTQALPA